MSYLEGLNMVASVFGLVDMYLKVDDFSQIEVHSIELDVNLESQTLVICSKRG